MAKQKKQTSEAAVREIRRRTRRKFSPEEKIRIVLEGLRGEQSVSESCRREGTAANNLYYRWSKDFLEAGKKQLAGDTVREATNDEVKYRAWGQDLIVRLHSFAALDVTRYRRLVSAWSEGECPRVRTVRRSTEFSDSIALAV